MTMQEIENMTHERLGHANATDLVDGTYLRVLLFAAQGKLGAKRGKRPDDATQLTALEAVGGPMYQAVLKGVTSEDIAIDATLDPAEITRRTRERNRRATFARTARSTLSVWVSEGGDLRALDVETVTKGELRAAINAARAEKPEQIEPTLERAQKAILAAIAREGPDEQRAHLEAVISALQDALEELPAVHEDTAVIRTRVGVPRFTGSGAQLHRGA
jgi:hypothetical protein